MNIYEGNKPYIFISYSHKDYNKVETIINRLASDGFRIWYDEGITPGREWDINIAGHLQNCYLMISMITDHYINSKNCLDELMFARDENKKILLVYIEETSLTPVLKMRVGRYQALFYYRENDTDSFVTKLYSADGITDCKEVEKSPTEATPFVKVPITDEFFPDPAFREYIKQFDLDNDGFFSKDELNAVTAITLRTETILPYKHVGSLEGIQYFTALQNLNCSYLNSLLTLDITHNSQLIELNCAGNKLKNLNLSSNPLLTILNCSYNSIKDLDVSNNVSLTHIYCYSNNLETLDLSNNDELTFINFRNNKLKTITFSNNSQLKTILCQENNLKSLDVSNISALSELQCQSNNLNVLDVSNNSQLKELDCSTNCLAALDISNSNQLQKLICNNNNIETLDISRNPALRSNYSNDQILNVDSTVTLLGPNI